MSRSVRPDPPPAREPACGVQTKGCDGRAVRLYFNPKTEHAFRACLACAAALKSAGFVFHRVIDS